MSDSARTRVLHARIDTVGGGIEVFVRNLAETIDRDEFELNVLAFSPGFALKDEFSRLGAPAWTIPPRRDLLRHLLAFRRLLVRERFDVVHLHKNSAADLSLALTVRTVRGLPLVVHSHSARTRPSRSLMHRLGRPLLNLLATRRVACSPVAARWLFGRAADRPGAVEVVPNGVDLDRFRRRPEVGATVRAELGLDGRFVVGHVGSFTYPKNHGFLLEVFKETLTLVPDAVLLLVGDGPLHDDVVAAVDRLGLRDHVVLAGVRQDVDRIYQAVDVFVMPSRFEGYPLAAIEASAVGLPGVVSAAVGATFDAGAPEAFTVLALEDGARAWAAAVLAARGSGHAPSSAHRVAMDRAATTDAVERIYRRATGRTRSAQGSARARG